MAFQNPFTWGAGGQKASPSSIKRQSEIAAALAARSGAPRNVGEGLNRVGEALLANSMNSRADAGAAEGATSRKAIMDALLGNPDPTMADIGGALGNEWVTSDPGSSAIVQALLGQEMKQNDPSSQLDMQYKQAQLDALQNPVPDPTYQMISPDDAKAMGLPDGTYQRAPDGQIKAVGGSGQTINIGDGTPGLGKLSTDYGYVLDESGKPKIDPATGLPTAAPVPGSPAALDVAKAAQAAQDKSAMTSRNGNIVVEDIDRALATLDKDPTWTTGVLGQLMGNLKGSSADRLNNLLDTVKANSGFDKLQQMRDASPTGGALGQVSEQENKLLQSAIGSLATSNADDLAYNLKRVQRIYDEIINGPKQDKPAGEADYNAETPPDDWGGDPALWPYMSPEDRALW
ncbi:hypothetical protein PSQ19_06000 [Devosia algicola]|uniref:Peptidoglycan-binding protein n=1 Tax=Devosia algicola TaxID=3026418 RepID=A0ABY7YQL7_9HYPH|nr:hypothetical protein [Devosia algicola]WDR03620.1 hypothetical protein PSQ19_06000 [Devosia algicola]